MSFNMVDIFTNVFNDLLSYMEIDHKFMCEVPESTFQSSEFTNTLVGISGDMEGNIMFGYTTKTAKEIAAKMMGRENIDELDIYAKSALADFWAEFCKRVAYTLKLENAENLKQGGKDYTLYASNPTYIAGGSMYAMISKVPSKKLFFKINGEKFDISYSLERK